MGKANRDAFCKSAALGLVFVTLGSCRVLLIRFSTNEDGKYEYLPVTVNMCAEILKLLVCSVLAIQVICTGEGSWRDHLTPPTRHDILPLLKWAVPGFLYFLDNLLAFFVIKYLQPAMAVLLGNFVIITTSVLFRIVLKRKLSRVQWAALLVLFLAILSLSHQSQGSITIEHHKHHAVNHIMPTNQQATLEPTSTQVFVDVCQPEETQFQVRNVTGDGVRQTEHVSEKPDSKWKVLNFHHGHLLILVQCFVSSLANIYNEKIFKEDNGLQESIYVQNSKLYFFGVFFNLLTLIVHGVYRQKLTDCGFFHGYNAFALILIFVTAMYGLNVAFILKFRDNMFHLLSSQLTTVIVISASVYFFHFKPHVEFFLTAPIILTAIYIFQMSKPKEEKSDANAGRPPDVHRIRMVRDVDEGDGFVISPDNLIE